MTNETSFPLVTGTDGTNSYLPIAHANGLFLGVRPITLLVPIVGPMGPVALNLAFGARIRMAAIPDSDVAISNVGFKVESEFPEMYKLFERTDDKRCSLVLAGATNITPETDFHALFSQILEKAVPALVDTIEEFMSKGDLKMDIPKETVTQFIHSSFDKEFGDLKNMLMGKKKAQKEMEQEFEGKVLEFKLPMLKGPDTMQ